MGSGRQPREIIVRSGQRWAYAVLKQTLYLLHARAFKQSVLFKVIGFTDTEHLG